MTKKGVLLAAATLGASLAWTASALAQWEKRGSRQQKAPQHPVSHAPVHRPPSLPAYRGQVMSLPHPGYRPPAAPAAPARPPVPSQRLAPPSPPRAGTPAYVSSPKPTAAPPPRAYFSPPVRDDRGRRFSPAPVASVSAPKTAAIVHETVANAAVAQSVAAAARSISDREQWYKSGGVRFVHRYDADHDRHWIGFHQSGKFFWTVYWGEHFWWREEQNRRWLAFWRDHWWWRSPQGAYFVYIDNQYYQWTPTPSSVVLVPSHISYTDPAAAGTGFDAPPLAALPKESKGETVIMAPQTSALAGAGDGSPAYHYSADGSRMVQIEGSEGSAFLYDNSKQDGEGNHPLIRYLAEGVSDVRFSDISAGTPLQIILTLSGADGSVRHLALDANGKPLGASVAQAEDAHYTASPAFGTPGSPGFDAPGSDLPPAVAPFPDGE